MTTLELLKYDWWEFKKEAVTKKYWTERFIPLYFKVLLHYICMIPFYFFGVFLAEAIKILFPDFVYKILLAIALGTFIYVLLRSDQ